MWVSPAAGGTFHIPHTNNIPDICIKTIYNIGDTCVSLRMAVVEALNDKLPVDLIEYKFSHTLLGSSNVIFQK